MGSFGRPGRHGRVDAHSSETLHGEDDGISWPATGKGVFVGVSDPYFGSRFPEMIAITFTTELVASAHSAAWKRERAHLIDEPNRDTGPFKF